MLAYSTFPSDVRIKREADALISKNYEVDVICLKEKNEIFEEHLKGINIYRISMEKKRGGIKIYFYYYNLAIIKIMLKLLHLSFRKNYTHIHIHNPPDHLLLAALPFKLLFRTKLILDIHDPLPEIFASRFEIKINSPIIKTMRVMEWICCKLADKIVTVNETIKDNLANNGIKNVLVVMNSADEKLFTEEKNKTSKHKYNFYNKFVVLYEGSIMKRRGLDVLIDSVALLKDKIPNIYCAIIGDGDYLSNLRQRVKDLGLDDYVGLPGKRPLEEMPEYVAISDVCVIPFIKSPINEIGVPNKLFEYMIYDKPMIIPKLKAMSRILSEDECFFFEPGNAADLAEKIMKIHKNPEKAIIRAEYAGKKFADYRWENMKNNLYECYEI